MTLSAIVIGAGFAAEGHTIALRKANVEVIAMCGRTPEPAHAMAKKLGITDLRFDWRRALAELKPDIVAITTPGKPHREMVEFAAAQGCHIACEKPLALNAADAEATLVAAEHAGVKHAYAATGYFAPQIAYIQELLAQEEIGQLQEFEYVVNVAFSRLLPYFWFHRLEDGGGALFQVFTHLLAQVSRATGGRIVAATGQARCLIDHAPVGPVLHDWRDFLATEIDPHQATSGEWRPVDADTGFSVLIQAELPNGNLFDGLFRVSAHAASQLPNHLTFYGTAGTLQLTGPGIPDQIHLYNANSKTWEERRMPHRRVGALSQRDERDHLQWEEFYREFVSDIRGETDTAYPTFHDGWIANQVIEAVRSGRDMREIRHEPTATL